MGILKSTPDCRLRYKGPAKNETFKIFNKNIFLSFIFASPAYAYVDGGAALFTLQGVFAAFGALMMFIKNPRQLIVRIFSRKKQYQAANDASESQ